MSIGARSEHVGGATAEALLIHSHAFKEPSAARRQLLVELGNEPNLQSK